MLITFTCEHCETKLEIEASSSGSEVACPTCSQALVVPRKGLEEGTTVGGFKIERLIGRGGMGEVYLARQLSMDRLVALKILPSQLTLQPQVVKRFLQEVRLTARLEHPHIVTAYEAGEDDGVLFLAMAFVDGCTLHDKLQRDGAMAERQALEILLPLAHALSYAWTEHQMLHRDIKPGNILLDARDVPKLTDLGLAKSLDQGDGMTLSGAVMGTPNYMSPEQAEGRDRLDCRADMYALGATLYHMVTGRIPFEGSTLMETLRRQAGEPLPDPRTYNAGLSEPCVRLLEIMMAKDPHQRHRAWGTLIADLERVLQGEFPAMAPLEAGESVLLRMPAADAARMTREKKRARAVEWTLKGLAAAAAVSAVGGIFYMVQSRRGPGDSPAVPPGESAPPDAGGNRGGAGEPPDRGSSGNTTENRGSVSIDELLAGGDDPDIPRGPGTGRAPGGIRPRGPPPRESPLFSRYSRPLAEIRHYAQEHPEDAEGALQRLDVLARSSNDPELKTRVKDLAALIRTIRDDAATRALKNTETEVRQRIAAHRFAEAAALLEAYAGPKTPDSLMALEQLAAEVKLAAQRAKAEERSRMARTAWEALQGDVAALVLGFDLAGARQKLESALSDPQLAPVKDEISTAAQLLADMPSVTEQVLASFAEERGKTVGVSFRDGRSIELAILGTADGAVQARKLLPQGFADITFRPAELSTAERYKRVGQGPAPGVDLLRGLLAVEAGNWSVAEQHFTVVGGTLGGALAAAVRERSAPPRP